MDTIEITKTDILADLRRGWRVDWAMTGVDDDIGECSLEPNLGPDATNEDIAVESENEDDRAELRRIVDDCYGSREWGREAADHLERGDIVSAYDAAGYAASTEREYGDDPFYGPIAEALARIADEMEPQPEWCGPRADGDENSTIDEYEDAARRVLESHRVATAQQGGK